MTKAEMKQMIIDRIKTEYRKYHDTPVDFMESAAIKIVLTLEQDAEQVKKLNIADVSKCCPNCDSVDIEISKRCNECSTHFD